MVVARFTVPCESFHIYISPKISGNLFMSLEPSYVRAWRNVLARGARETPRTFTAIDLELSTSKIQRSRLAKRSHVGRMIGVISNQVQAMTVPRNTMIGTSDKDQEIRVYK